MAMPVEAAEGAVALKGYQQITSLSSATSLTVPDGCFMAIITPETQGVRWRDDGTAPTASVGMPLSAGASFKYTGGYDGLKALKFIEQAASAKLNVAYYGSAR
jgi:hypothetical protein